MNALWQIFRMILLDQRRALMRGAVLSLAVLLAGIALLGLSGWFITAAAAAGLAGMGAVFDVFRPAAMVRFLALGRTAARYGERLLTHDATLRALTSIRVRLLQATMSAPHDMLVRLRGPQTLNRLMADVDALDGVPLRQACWRRSAPSSCCGGWWMCALRCGSQAALCWVRHSFSGSRAASPPAPRAVKRQ